MIDRFRLVAGYYPDKKQALELILAEYNRPDSVLQTEAGARQFVANEAGLYAKRIKSKISIGINLLRLALEELRQQAQSRSKRQNAWSGVSPL